jgi:pimeloyl-ACP methyl ester carboxylesterase
VVELNVKARARPAAKAKAKAAAKAPIQRGPAKHWSRQTSWGARLRALLVLVVVAIVLGGAVAVGAAAMRETGARQVLAPSTGRFVRSHDVELFIQETGPADGPVVLFTHGTGAWSEIWRSTLDRVAAEGFRAVAVDLPPFGFSERPSSGDYTTATQGRRLAALIDSLGAQEITVVGHSFGARAAIEAVLLAPQRLKSLVLVDAALGLYDANGAAVDVSTVPADPGPLSAALGFPPISRPLVASTLTNPLLSRTLLELLISRKEAATPALVATLQRPLELEGSTAALGRWLQWFVQPDMPERSGRIASYASLKMPVLLLWGETDSLTPLPQGRALSTELPTSKLVVLEGTGHIPAIENPAAFNDALVEFLAATR